MRLMILGICKRYTKEIIIKNQVYDYYEKLTTSKKLETKYILIDEKSYCLLCTKKSIRQGENNKQHWKIR